MKPSNHTPSLHRPTSYSCSTTKFSCLSSTENSELTRSACIYLYTDGMTHWTSDQLIAKPLPKHRTTQTQNKRIHTPNIHALSGIRSHDPGFRASEDSSCLRPRGYCARHLVTIQCVNESAVRRNVVLFPSSVCFRSI
jgi:hypothetical protein